MFCWLSGWFSYCCPLTARLSDHFKNSWDFWELRAQHFCNFVHLHESAVLQAQRILATLGVGSRHPRTLSALQDRRTLESFFNPHVTHVSYNLNSLKGGYIGDYIGDYKRVS